MLTFITWLTTQSNRLPIGRGVYDDKCMPRDADLDTAIAHIDDRHPQGDCTCVVTDLTEAYDEYLAKVAARG